MTTDLDMIRKRIEKDGFAITKGDVARRLSKHPQFKAMNLRCANNRRKRESIIYRPPRF